MSVLTSALPSAGIVTSYALMHDIVCMYVFVRAHVCVCVCLCDGVYGNEHQLSHLIVKINLLIKYIVVTISLLPFTLISLSLSLSSLSKS